MPTPDFSYKKDALRTYYDIESLPSVFTCTFLNHKSATLWFYGAECYDYISDEELVNAFYSYIAEEGADERLLLSSDIKINLLRVHENNMKELGVLRREIKKFMTCKPLASDNENKDFCEYIGWNSSSYDLPMLILMSQLLQKNSSPYDIRKLSDALISFKGRSHELGSYMQRLNPVVGGLSYTQSYNVSVFYDGHIDIAKMLRSQDDNGEQMFPPALKLQEARLGMDIIADGAVSDSNPDSVMEKDELLDFIKYNLHDVVATRMVGNTKDVKDKIFVRDMVREMYPYTSARSYSAADVLKRCPPERDITEAQLAARSFVGEKFEKPVDYSVVSYEFPVPDGEGGHKQVDLLEYMKEKEPFMPDMLYKFFDFWRGQNTSTWAQFYAASKNLSRYVGGKTNALNIPYYRKSDNGMVPIDAYIRISTGGAHGSVWAGMSEMEADTIQAWTNADATPSKTDKQKHVPTLDLKDVIHIDFTSYYPTLAVKMGIYKRKDGSDPMKETKDARVRIKEELAAYPDKSQWGDEQIAMNNQQLALKMQVNAPTGASNMHSEYALLPLDNKILSMRLIGNFTIWCLSQRMIYAGGYVVSTNTDGIYVAGMKLEDCQKVLDGFVKDYDIPVDPELCDRFINRDVSNRLELLQHDDGSWFVNDCRGRLRSGTKLMYTDAEHGHKVAYPLAVANAVIRYMVEDDNWSHKAYDRERMKAILEDIRDNSDIMAWVQIYSGSSARHLLSDGKTQQKVSRIALTKNGQALSQMSLRRPKKQEIYEIFMRKDEFATIAELSAALGMEFNDEVNRFSTKGLAFCKKTPAKQRRAEDTYEAAQVYPIGDNGRYPKDAADSILVNGIELKVWAESILTGYPTDARGKILNAAKDLWSFDLADLDMDAYLEWAESMLSVWKIGARLDFSTGTLIMEETGDIFDKSQSKPTKKMLALTDISELYRGVVNA